MTAIGGDTAIPSAMIDCQFATENLFLAAHAMGVGTFYMGFPLLGRDDPEMRWPRSDTPKPPPERGPASIE